MFCRFSFFAAGVLLFTTIHSIRLAGTLGALFARLAHCRVDLYASPRRWGKHKGLRLNMAFDVDLPLQPHGKSLARIAAVGCIQHMARLLLGYFKRDICQDHRLDILGGGD